MQERRYDDKEVAQILSKAAAAQAASSELASANGTTLAELERIAGEVGIDPGNILRAATELDRQRQDRSDPKSNSVLLEQSIDGELSEETWDQLVTELQAYVGNPGKSEARGQTREWRGVTGTERTMLSVTSRNGRTQIKMLVDASEASTAYTLLGTMIGFFATLVPLIISAKHHFSMGAGITVALMASVALFVTLATKGLVQNNRKKLRPRAGALMDRIIAAAETEVSNGASSQMRATIATANSASEPSSDTLRKTLSS